VLGTAIGTGKERVLAVERDRADGALDGVFSVSTRPSNRKHFSKVAAICVISVLIQPRPYPFG
jgi:hypothetical protein